MFDAADVMREAETRPITRAIRATRFAFGILIAARTVARFRPSSPPLAAADNAHLTNEAKTTGVDEDSGLEEADMDVVVTLEGVDLEAVNLDDFAVNVDVDLEVDVGT